MKRLVLLVAACAITCLCEASAVCEIAIGGFRQQALPPGGQSDAEWPATAASHTGVLIGKFEILATFTYAKALRDGRPDSEAKRRGIMAAVMGARSRGVSRGGPRAPADTRATKAGAAIKQQTLTAAKFDEQVAAKLQPFYDSIFLPAIKKMVDARLTYDQVKGILKISPAVGAKITAKEFAERMAAYWKESRKPGQG
jgi:hypothetical protein